METRQGLACCILQPGSLSRSLAELGRAEGEELRPPGVLPGRLPGETTSTTQGRLGAG